MGEKLQVIRATGKESLWADHGSNKQNQRLKIWEIDNFFKCPMVGTCLTLTEQKHLLKKAGICRKKKSAYDIHEILVASLESENRLTKKFENMLKKKFGKESSRLCEMPEEEFMEHWRSCFNEGDYKAALWAAARRPDLRVECRREIFGMVHMAMHWNSEQRATTTIKLAVMEKKEAAIRRRWKKGAGEKKELERKNRRLQVKNNALQARVDAVMEENSALARQLADLMSESRVPELEQQLRQLREERTGLSGTIDELSRRIDAMTEKHRRQSETHDQLMASNAQLEQTMWETIRSMHRINLCDENCPAFDLCKKRVLIVGGIARMESLYRQLIESSGGHLEYHDGNMNGGARQLENSLKRADLVLCPVNCNSHTACSLVKTFGKKHNKRVHMMPNFSLSAVSRMISGNGCENMASN